MSANGKTLMDQAFAALLSDDDKKVLGAIAYVHERGDARAIFPLLHALVKVGAQPGSEAAVRRQQKIHDLLYEVKVKGAAEELAKALDDPALRSVRKSVIAAFWNAGLDAAPYTDKLIACAIEGSAEECFECLTVLENQEVLSEKAVLRGIKEVSGAIATNTDDYKGAMLGNLLVELKARVGRD